MSKFYVTTSIPYANANPHIGFSMEAVEADFLARYHRLIGDDVYFLTGTDEHGMKIHDTAEELGITPQEHVDNIAEKLTNRGYDVEALHGDLSQNQRERIMDKFKKKLCNILVVTDIASRGLDIVNLTHVINFALPQDSITISTPFPSV